VKVVSLVVLVLPEGLDGLHDRISKSVVAFQVPRTPGLEVDAVERARKSR